jgi:hypothetical protein
LNAHEVFRLRFCLPVTLLFAISTLVGALLAPHNLSAASGLVEVAVFRSGTEGYHTFRIPAIVSGTNGTLLAFAEGRKNSASDTGDIDLVLKRSFDRGLTWGPLQLVGDDGANTIGNPTPIVDLMTGKILLLTTRNDGKVTETQVRAGEAKDRRVFIQESADCGATWSAPREITSETKRSNWRWYATGPVHGIQLARGAHAGRLIAPCDHTTTNSAGWSACGSHLLYSDDHGLSWLVGADESPNNGTINPNECAAVELTDGRIYVLARNQNGRATGNRAIGYSGDAGKTFEAPFAINSSLVSPVVQGSLLRYSALDQGGDVNRILFAAPGDPAKRTGMTVRSSFDEARSWNSGKVIYRGPSAYSDLVKLPGGQIGLLYESGGNNPYERITFAIFDLEFLDALPPSANKNLRSAPSVSRET